MCRIRLPRTAAHAAPAVWYRTCMGTPLAVALRPRTLDEVVGQEHLVGKGKPLRRAMEEGARFSFILWGPPGCGKTTLARLYARALHAPFYELSAVSASKADVARILKEGARQDAAPVLFLDEIHRFNKAQQDALLPAVEEGTLTLVGATTENPSFSVIGALLSRCRVFLLHPLSEEELIALLARTPWRYRASAARLIARAAQGDARRAFALAEAAAAAAEGAHITEKAVRAALADEAPLRYDRAGDEHYDTISAFIKTMRAGDADAALYYLARMVAAGEDPRFIARRMVIFASEDVGLAQPTALVVANAVLRACETIGYPECAINLAHGAAYLARAQKDRSAYRAYRAAEKDVRAFGSLPVPKHLRNAPTRLMQELGYAAAPEKGAHNFPRRLGARNYFKQEES